MTSVLPTRRPWLARLAAACVVVIAGCDSSDGGDRAVRELNSLTGPTRVATVEFSEGTNMAAAPSPDGRQIAFTAQGALWVMPAAGGTARRITPWTLEPTAPVWSPDGSVIAFQNYTADGNWHIWSIRPDGSEAKELTTGFFDDREPAWTPDGEALVFASDRSGDGQMKIRRFSIADGRYTQITQGPGAESNPAVSADGTQLAFVDSNRIFVVPLSGGTPAQVATGSMPSWPAAGDELIHQSTSTTLNVGGNVVATGEDLFPFPARLMGERLLYTADGRIRTRGALRRHRHRHPVQRGDPPEAADLGHEEGSRLRRLRAPPGQGHQRPGHQPGRPERGLRRAQRRLGHGDRRGTGPAHRGHRP
ncbi:MAG: hypothetical protein MZW92_80915 [Comamonadaceae bacterium]|nr:hypothetical protein [Comamonadaceae bacterium]